MNFIVCRHCKKYVGVNALTPLQFDKCQNCGHTLEFAADEFELNSILKNKEIPEIKSVVKCSSCGSINPKEAGVCLFCGADSLVRNYDTDSMKNYIDMMNDAKIDMSNDDSFKPEQNSNNWIFRIVSLFIGLIDFFFFAIMGITFVVGDISNVTDPLLFAQEHFQPILLVLIFSLFFAGFLSIFVLPKMRYSDSFQVASSVGIIIGLFSGIVVQDIQVIIFGILLCGIITGLGGLVGEILVQRIARKLGPKI